MTYVSIYYLSKMFPEGTIFSTIIIKVIYLEALSLKWNKLVYYLNGTPLI